MYKELCRSPGPSGFHISSPAQPSLRPPWPSYSATPTYRKGTRCTSFSREFKAHSGNQGYCPALRDSQTKFTLQESQSRGIAVQFTPQRTPENVRGLSGVGAVCENTNGKWSPEVFFLSGHDPSLMKLM